MFCCRKRINIINPRLRFLIYAIIGLIFGVIDWFYLDWLAHISWGSLGESVLVVPIIIAMNYGIWLVPILPLEFYEARNSEKSIFPMFAGILTWSCAIFSYYGYYAVLLSLGKLINLENLNIIGEKNEAFWHEYWRMFDRIITGQFLEWILIAIIGGAVTGALTFWFFHKIKPDRKMNSMVN
jgi:hypothetical protein